MPSTTVLRSIKGKVARITRLDACGVPIYGPSSVIVTEGFITVTFSTEMEAGETQRQRNAWGTLCINERDPATPLWQNVRTEFCEINPDALDVMGGANPVVVGDVTVGWTIGPNAHTEAFALEVWTKAVGQNACAGGVQQWGYAAWPFIKNGELTGDMTISNAPMNVSVAGQGFGAPATWGMTPHRDNPIGNATGFPAGEFRYIGVTSVQPPAPTVGAVELFGPISAATNNDVFGREPTITGQDSTNAAKLTPLGYVASPQTAWTTGQKITVNGFQFSWTGSAWAAGPRP